MLSRYLEPLLPVEPAKTPEPARQTDQYEGEGFSIGLVDKQRGALVVYLPNGASGKSITLEAPRQDHSYFKDEIFARAVLRNKDHQYSVAALFEDLLSRNYRLYGASNETFVFIPKGKIVVVDWR